ncbi:hypothetical protein Barb7_02181 [Bacteroidales bacterium Barb7]|nr:hypothetical protein Barb7_02181 [Bacteroidales bacterium Barb7]
MKKFVSFLILCVCMLPLAAQVKTRSLVVVAEPQTKAGAEAAALQKVYPEFVEVNREGNYEVDYTELVPALLEDVQHLKGKVENLQASFSAYKQSVDTKLASKDPVATVSADDESVNLLERIKELQAAFSNYRETVALQFASLEPRLLGVRPSIANALVTFTEEGANRNENKRGVLKVSNKVPGLKVSVDLSNDPDFGSLLYHIESSDSEISVPLDEYKAQYLRVSSSRYDLRIMAEASRTIWYADANGDKQSIDK